MEIFEVNLLKPLLDLALDEVPNVRLCVGRCLTQSIIVQGKISTVFLIHIYI